MKKIPVSKSCTNVMVNEGIGVRGAGLEVVEVHDGAGEIASPGDMITWGRGCDVTIEIVEISREKK